MVQRITASAQPQFLKHLAISASVESFAPEGTVYHENRRSQRHAWVH